MSCPYTKAVVLGAGGFIGINLVQSLVARGFEVVCFDRAACAHWPTRVKVVTGEFQEVPAALVREMHDAVVFHLVSSCKPVNSTTNAADEVAAELLTTIRFLELTKERRIRWVFLSSGGTVYGNTAEAAIPEGHPENPLCTYGVLKLAVEKYFQIYWRLHALDHVVVRLANPYGPWQFPGRGQGVIANMLAKAMRDEEIEIWGDGEQVRDYIYIDDAVDGILAAARSGATAAVYNVGSGVGRSINDLTRLIAGMRSAGLKVKYVPGRAVDVARNVLNIGKISGELGWAPKTSEEQGLENTRRWLEVALA